MSDAALNTDRELYRELDKTGCDDSIHVTRDGSIGVNVGGHVIVMPLRKWHALASDEHTARQRQLADLEQRLK